VASLHPTQPPQDLQGTDEHEEQRRQQEVPHDDGWLVGWLVDWLLLLLAAVAPFC
jgi:hypothetical protein